MNKRKLTFRMFGLAHAIAFYGEGRNREEWVICLVRHHCFANDRLPRRQA